MCIRDSWIFEETNLLADIEKNHVPIVIVGRDLTARKISSLFVDNEAGGSLALRHLSELGHRRIAVIRGPEELFDSEPRWAGVRRAAEEAGIETVSYTHLDVYKRQVRGCDTGAELHKVEDVAGKKRNAVDGFRGDQLAYG